MGVRRLTPLVINTFRRLGNRGRDGKLEYTHTVTSGDKPSALIEGKTELNVEPFTGADGSATTVSNAMFGFAPTYKIGKGSGHSDAFGMMFDARYGETADFEFSTEMAGEVHPRA